MTRLSRPLHRPAAAAQRSRPWALLAAALTLCLAIAACSSDSKDERPQRKYPAMSPNGEMLSGGPLGQASCRDALGRWFDRLAGGPTGTIDAAAFDADARSQFAAMDLDHDGFVTPSELATYRAPYMPPPAPEVAVSRPVDPHRTLNDDRPASDYYRPGGRSRPTAQRDPAADRPDPVMAADVHLRNRVSLEDFLAHAERRFAALDTGHAGRLSREDVLRSCTPGS